MSKLHLSEDKIPRAKLEKEIKKLTKSEAIRWLKCRGCQNLSQPNLKDLKHKQVIGRVSAVFLIDLKIFFKLDMLVFVSALLESSYTVH